MGKRDGWEKDDDDYPRHEDEDKKKSTIDNLRTVMDITVSGVQQRFNR